MMLAMIVILTVMVIGTAAPVMSVTHDDFTMNIAIKSLSIAIEPLNIAI